MRARGRAVDVAVRGRVAATRRRHERVHAQPALHQRPRRPTRRRAHIQCREHADVLHLQLRQEKTDYLTTRLEDKSLA